MDKERRRLSRELFEEIGGQGIGTSRAVELLISNIWAVTHDTSISQVVMLRELSVLSGMAVSALHDYAKLLKAGGG